ncbi:response regulator transcription factor [Asanoa sp. WMMD1127]|uniref:response regulator n=1 Tax=Asanoa sp. WMMD1127 TaxID=3016107 RepID=UPI002415D2D4|nr:response regulator transcription factor [Asanoa sp. WMMD1127]MDG4820781.1 response regulator transcription factor [Asanoa sp. WMMD1127]
MIRLLLADDQVLVRAGLRATLDEPDIEVVAEAGTGVEAIELARAHRPDVVLMDIRMPVVDGLEATRRIVSDPELADVRVVVLTTFDEDDYVYEALRVGASGFLLKDIEPEALVAGVRAVARGDALLAPSVTRRMIAGFAGRPARYAGARLDVSGLTRREYDVLLLVVAGLANNEIAERLGMSPATAKTHITRILAKLNARDRAQLVVLAYESGLVEPGWLR